MYKGPIKLLSFADDVPQDGTGSLIPKPPVKKAPPRFQEAMRLGLSLWLGMVRVGFATVAVLLVGVVSISGYGLVADANLAAVPAVFVIDPKTDQVAPLAYGPQPSLSDLELFTQTKNTLSAEARSFIAVDLEGAEIEVFINGVLLFQAAIESSGVPDSWWETPSGLYQINKKSERDFLSIGQVYLPWEVTFGGNYVIHGQPFYPDGSSVSADFLGGGIRLADTEAEKLFSLVTDQMPVLVHAQSEQSADVFVYQPQVPNLATPHYFIADIDNGTVLAATELADPAPIASLTKLMTAVVAAEQLDLDGRVQVSAPNFVTSLVPRLAGRSSVSMYSLLQLLLVESSNEAAETIAGDMGRESFISAMNTKAKELGMEHTTFVDPSGLGDGNVSSLGDLFKLVDYIYHERHFIFEITAQEKLPLSYISDEFSNLTNFNGVKGLDNFRGGKVGETLAAGETSISLHELTIQGQQRTVVVILLGSKSRTADIKELLGFVEKRFGN